MKINKIYIPIFVFLLIAIGFLLGNFFVSNTFSKMEPKQSKSKQKINRLLDFINQEYVDKVNTDSIVALTVDEILAKLDPHSVYIPQTDAQAIAEEMQGNFVGIGVNFFIENDSVTVIKPIEKGPSEIAGIKAGDRILKANNTVLHNQKITNEKLFSILKGQENSKINLEIYRKNENKKFKITVTRKVVPVKSVDVALLLNQNTGYIKINRFSQTTHQEFVKAFQFLNPNKINHLVLDLRDNGGGFMEEAIKIADDFLTENQLIVFTKNKKGRIDKTFATENGLFENGKVSILMNENSASASEILAGAIQDNDKGTIIGRRSFGKGLVQREMPLGDGSNVRLTVARYYTPTGRSIQKPYKDNLNEYNNEFFSRYNSGELYAKDSIKIADTLKFKTKKGKIVFGGGGIVPDVFVPVETKKGSEIVEMLMKSGAVTNFVFKTIDKNRLLYQKLNSNQLKEKIIDTDEIFKDFEKYVSKTEKLPELSANKNYIKKYLLAEFNRQLFNETASFKIILQNDAMIKEVLKN